MNRFLRGAFLNVVSSCTLAMLIAAQWTCTDRSPDHSSFTVRDSAGVAIVESHEAAWGEGEGWRLSEDPIVTIGTEDGPEEYSLFRVEAARRLPNGLLVIANGGSNELRYYDSSGIYLYSAGRDGFGPGEFKEINGA